MTARAIAWFEDDDPRDLWRWSLAAAVVVAIHAAAISGYLFWHQPDDDIVGDELPVISVEFTAAQIDMQEQAKVETPTPQQETSQDAILPEEKPPEKVEQTTPAPRTTMAEVASAPRIDPSWVSLLSKHMLKFQNYPNAARARNEQGLVKVAVTIDRAGHVLARHILQSSGFPDLDAEAMAWIERAQPMPAFPPSMAEAEIDDLALPLRFKLH